MFGHQSPGFHKITPISFQILKVNVQEFQLKTKSFQFVSSHVM